MHELGQKHLINVKFIKLFTLTTLGLNPACYQCTKKAHIRLF